MKEKFKQTIVSPGFQQGTICFIKVNLGYVLQTREPASNKNKKP